MSSQLYPSELGTFTQNHMPSNYDQFKENDDINKDSVKTSIGHKQKQNEATFKNSITTKKEPTDTKKTKFIWKPQIKKAAPILKHKKVVQTLRNITKNIKSQLSTFNKSKKQTPKDKCKANGIMLMEEENQHQQQSQVNQIYLQSQKQDKKDMFGPSNRIINQAMQIQTKELPNFNVNQQIVLEEFVNSKTKQQILSPQKSNINIKKSEHVLLYSKYKNFTESFPVYEDCMLSDNKQFRNLTIHREYDNDIDSDQQQVQMGVGFMYQQLMYSCHKYSEMKQQRQLLVQSSYVKRQRNTKDHALLEKVKQKLVFK